MPLTVPGEYAYDFPSGAALTTPQPIGPKCISLPLKQDTRAVVMRQRFAQLSANFTPLPVYSDWIGPGVTHIRTAGPTVLGQATWLVDNTDLNDEGGGDYITWTRVYASVPGRRQEPVVVSKQYQSCDYQFNGSDVLIDAQIYSFSTPVFCYAYYSYFLAGDTPGGWGGTLPQVPYAAIVSLGSGSTLFRNIAGYQGFPYSITHGHSLPFNNFAPCAISIQCAQYLGNIWEYKVVWG
jgi:hypothetical protein